ncbi:hypothetical protein SNEBB_000184 [Seison nebaliae]|nr:hypothetical protein SNEBB_000184 [Seison nebaliae]
MNAPDRYENFTLLEGEKKVLHQETNIPNTTVFIINKEDATLGNVLRDQILKNPKVKFAGFRIPHPLETKFELRIQTKDEHYKPVDAFNDAISELISTVTNLQGIVEKTLLKSERKQR